MKLVRLVAVASAALILWVPWSVHARSSAARGPVSSNPLEVDAAGVLSGPVAVNPAGTSVLLGDYVATSQAFADDTTGSVSGYAGFELGSTVPVTETPLTFAQSNVTGTATVAGTSGVIVFEYRFHGSFSVLAGSPFLQLVGTLASLTPADGLVTAQLTFEMGLEGPELGTRSVTIQGFPPGEPFAGATTSVESDALNNLLGVARIEATVSAGDEIVVETDLLGFAGPGRSGSDFVASAGIVDFLSTGQLKIFVPKGMGLDSADALFAPGTVVVEVPEPAPFVLATLGLVPLLVVARKRRASPRAP